MTIPEQGSIPAFAMIVDVNGFTNMVKAAEADDQQIAQFISDVLDAAIQAIDDQGGEIVGIMGDAVLGLLSDGDAVFSACLNLAKQVNRDCEHISLNSGDLGDFWSFCPQGPSIKIAAEYGQLNIARITSRFMGSQRLVIGSAINHASRISNAGKGNRCVVGPEAAKMVFLGLGAKGPYFHEGKAGEDEYEYYEYSMGDIWKEGEIKPGQDTYWS